MRAAACGAFALLLLVSLLNIRWLEQYFVKKYYYYLEHSENLATLLGPMNDVHDVFRVRSPYQNIDIVYDSVGYQTDILIDAYSTKFVEDPSQPRNYVLFLNGDLQFTSSYEELYHEFFAHVPVIVNGKVPSRVLVMGGGDGLLMRELIKYEQLRDITHVDLDGKLLELATTNPVLTALNRGALQDPRIETHIGDAYQYIRNTTEVFDAIYLDFPYALDYNLSKLYSREFFHFVREHLSDDGYAVLDAPAIGVAWEIYYQTIRKAGFGTILPYMSNLEVDNPRAYEILETSQRWSHLPDTMRQSVMQSFVRYHVKGLRQGFILMHKDTGARGHYRELGIKLHVLNEERFQLAFAQAFPVTNTTDDSKVNSIMRPTLPIEGIWKTRTAW